MRNLKEIKDKLKKITTDIEEEKEEIRCARSNNEDCSDCVERLEVLMDRKQLLEWVLS